MDVFVCPGCGQKLRVRKPGAPLAPRPAEQNQAIQTKPEPVPAKGMTPRVELVTPDPVRVPLPPQATPPAYEVLEDLQPNEEELPPPILIDEPDEDEPDPDQRGGRRKKKRRRKKYRRMDRILPWVSNFVLGLAVVLLLWGGLVAFSLTVRPVGLLVGVFGAFLIVFGVAWMVSFAIEEGVQFIPGFTAYGYGRFFGMFMLLVGCLNLLIMLLYSFLFLLFMNPQRTWKPVLLLLIGGLMIWSGVVLVRMELVSLR